MKVTLIQQTPNPIETIAQIASICYDSDPKNPLALVKHLYRNGHHSVFEHIYFTFKIEGISRACSHQIVRHRMCAFTQRSQRYCSEDGFGYVQPPTVGTRTYDDFMTSVREEYDLLQKLRVPNEDARYVLPNACETSLYLSCNLRELIHICNERLCSRAQWEIRMMVSLMAEQVDKSLWWMLVPKCKSGFLVCNSPCKQEV